MPIAADPRCSRGLVLVASLLVLLVLALLAATVLETGLLQLRMISQLEDRARARQEVLGQLQVWLDYLGTSVPEGDVGDRHCTADSNCEYPGLPAELVAGGSDSVLRILGSAEAIPRLAEAEASSAVAYRATRYELTVDSRPQGAAVSMTQGVTVLHPAVSP